MEDRNREDEFANWIEEHRAILHKVANVFALPVDRDDLMQQMLVSLWKALPSFRGEAKSSTFTYRVVHNCALTWVRGEARRRTREAAVADSIQTLETPTTARDSRAELLYECIRQLPPVDRSVITMSLDGLSHSQIGEVIGAKENAISVRLHRIRKQLAETMKERMK